MEKMISGYVLKFGETLKVVSEAITLTEGLRLQKEYATLGIQVYLGSELKVYRSKRVSSKIVNDSSAICIVTGGANV